MTKLLILEDREQDVDLMLIALRRAGLEFEHTHAQNKAEFESALTPDIDVILADYSLPGFNAMAALLLVKESGLGIPFIVVTGTICAHQALECLRAGAADYLFKDRLERLGVAVSRAIQQKEIDRDKHLLQIAQAQFIQNVSHEFRTPLGLIMGHANLLSSADDDFSLGPLNEYQKQSLDVICRRSEQLNKLVNDILILMELDQACLDGGYRAMSNVDTLNISAILSQMMLDFEPMARSQSTTLISDIEDDVFVRSSPKLVSAMLDNLISNAIKFTEYGSVSVSLHRTNEETVLAVRDTGVGMEPDDLKHIFARFCQVDGSTTRTYGGTGLGLSVVKEVVLSLGGRIDVESELGVGSTFTISLPLEET